MKHKRAVVVLLLAFAGCLLVGAGRPAQVAVAQAPGWKVVPAPNPSFYGSRLQEAEAISASNVWAVGFIATYAGKNTLIEHWNGSSWKVVPSPNPGTPSDKCIYENNLIALDVLTPRHIWAVGYYKKCYGFSRTLILRWDGVSWRVVPSPSIDKPPSSVLTTVEAVSGTDAWAAGYAYGDLEPGMEYPPPVIEHFDGRSWTLVASPTQASGGGIADLAAVSANDVWAVGTCPKCRYGILIEHWDGTSWKIVPSALLPIGSQGSLGDMVAFSHNDIWAVGNYYHYPEGIETLVEHWDGLRWRVVPSPNVSTEYSAANSFRGITAISPNDMWAVGTFENEKTDVHQPRTLTAHWDGKSWSIVPSPSPGRAAELYSVTSLPSGEVWGVGIYDDDPMNTYDGTYNSPAPLVLRR
jgi:hypothetical protein